MTLSKLCPLTVDISEHQGNLTKAEVDLWVREGVEAAILNIRDAAWVDRNVPVLRAAELDIFGPYVYLVMGYWETTHGLTLKAIDRAREWGCEWVGLDAEDNGASSGVSERVNTLLHLVDLVEDNGLKPYIYTGRWYWVPQMGNSTLFAGLPLWLSDYTTRNEPKYTTNFGGWSTVSMHQFTSTPPAPFRSSLDLNYITDMGAFQMVTQKQYNELEGRFDRLNGAVVKRHNIQQLAYGGYPRAYRAMTALIDGGIRVGPQGLDAEQYLQYVANGHYRDLTEPAWQILVDGGFLLADGGGVKED